ncbi:outer membrane lipoprotein chaperone LolA [Psychromonas sp. KJ10-10]|uniref:outer membrane lipoprotein chaperone LolA n=1 Tax=Psychromonas sp. KJ10-10 TaxID=3391823 RepID=UPI0039B56048
MKNNIKTLLLSSFLFLFAFTASMSASALSEDALQLKNKLALFEHVNATFVQRITSAEGKLLNESRGEMSISRPGKFHWHIKTPDEDLIVSNGETIWYYSPFIEQVTLINFADAVDGTPFALLAGASETQWSDYDVSKKGNQFSVKHATSTQASMFIFEFDEQDNVSKFVVIEEQGQRSEFLLENKQSDTMIDQALFEFQIPQGVEVDDQR